MDGLQWKTLLKWMIWGYPYFWKHPYMIYVNNRVEQPRMGVLFSTRSWTDFPKRKLQKLVKTHYVVRHSDTANTVGMGDVKSPKL